MSTGAALDRMDRNPSLGVPGGTRWFTFTLLRSDGKTDRLDTADPGAAAFVVRAWERDPRSLLITLQAEGGRAAVIYRRKAELGFIRDLEEAHGAPVVCHNEWCPFFPDPAFGDICRKCPSCNVND